jgi:hypothetical protein
MASDGTDMPAPQSSDWTKQRPKNYNIVGWEVVKEDFIALYKTKTLEATIATIEEIYDFERR